MFDKLFVGKSAIIRVVVKNYHPVLSRIGFKGSFGLDGLFDRSGILEMDIGQITMMIYEYSSAAISSFGKESSQNATETRGV